MTKKLTLVIIPVVVLLICCLGVLLFLPGTSNESVYLQQIKVASKYKEDGEYQKAILYYQNAIAEDDTQEEPYLEIANIYYYNLNDLDNAIDILKQGLECTNSVNLQNALQRFQYDLEETTTAVIDTAVGSINSSIIDVFTTYTYKDYNSTYTLKTENVSGNSYTVQYTQFDASFVYYNTDEFTDVINSSTGKPQDNVRPSEIKFNNIDTLISGASSGVSLDTLKKNGAMNAKVSYNNSLKIYLVNFTYNNCSFSIECSSDGKISGDNIYNLIAPQQCENKVKLSGSVYNKNNSNLIEKAQLDFRKGTNNKADTPVATYTTTSGSYYIELDPDDYTVEVSSSGFTPEYFNLSLSGGETNQDFSLVPVNSNESIKVVLEWTDSSTHVTSHAYCLSSTGYSMGEIGDYQGYHGDTLYNGDTLLADYKRDESAKTETTTFYDPNGSYEFHIHYDFENPDVTVKVYMPGESEPVVITDPDSSWVYTNFYWIAFEINDGKLSGIHGKEN
jgi:tetratricopeptide (TPR) repeat protein